MLFLKFLVDVAVISVTVYFVKKYRKKHSREIAAKKELTNSIKSRSQEHHALYKSVRNSFKTDSAQRFGKFYFDSNSQKIFEDNGAKKYEVFNYSDILGFNPIEHIDSTSKKHGITRSIVGGALAGAGGAIVGANTSKNINSIDLLGVSLSLKGNRSCDVMLINSPTKNQAIISKSYQEYSHLCALLNGIMAQRNVNL